MKTLLGSLFSSLVLLTSDTVAQQPAEQPPANAPQQSAATPPGEQSQQMLGMDKMAESVTRMSEMCEMMMKKEMAAMPWKIGAGIALVALVFVNLVLLAILQMLWIKYWRGLLTDREETALK